MRNLMLLLLLTSSGLTHAQTLGIRCEQCRDPHEFPRDYGNFAFNQVFGAYPRVSRSDGSRMKIVNPKGRWALVELDHKLSYTPFRFSIAAVSMDAVMISPEIQVGVYTDTGLHEVYPTVPAGSDLIVGPTPEYGTAAIEYEFLDPPVRDFTGSSGSYTPYRPLMSYPGASSKTFVIVGPSY